MWVDLPQLRKPSWRLFCGQQRYGRQLDWRIVELNSRCDCMSACGRCPLLGGWVRLHKCAVLSFGFTIKELKHTPNNKAMVRSIFTQCRHCYHPCHPVWALWRVSLLSIPPAGEFLCPLASLQERRAEDGSIGSYSQCLVVASLRNCPLGNEFFPLM